MVSGNWYCSRSTAWYAGGGPAAPGTGKHDDNITNNTTREHWWNQPSGMTAQRRLNSKIGRVAPSARGQAWETQYSNEFQQIVDAAEGLVVFTFGSVAAAHQMPMSWKLAFIDAFKRFPKYHFIWRYAGSDLQDKLPANVHPFKWIPQSDLLQHPKTKAFLSHGGYNSLQEAISAGVPLVTIALFGDQPKNAKIAERHRFSINLRKSDLSADTIADALTKLFKDPR
ncbi:hypothetical protein Y032_0027g1499 [Ancylostoma ceylanicum]|uniref:UDP-glucuronosyltransferase n=1 Tax=Ancylostoma ceylanicum TaxID=53326 RepID=A0A016USJ1_9BILA|nr:hypothetical protein Y032_0027g1499 [Ancylostoma ceylanicum]